MRKGEDLGGIGERNGTFSRRIEGAEQEDEKGDDTDVGVARFRNVKGESGSQKGPGHLGESEQEKGPSPVGINCSDGRPGEADRKSVSFVESEGGSLGHT